GGAASSAGSSDLPRRSSSPCRDRTHPSKLRGGGPFMATECGGEMARAAETNELGDLFDGERRSCDEQASRGRHTPPQYIGVRWQLQALSKCALEVARAHAGEAGELAQRDRSGEVRLDVIDDGTEATSQAA